MKAHFVTFYSPGTMVAETTIEPIDNWDVPVAEEMAKSIIERHGARPYGFCFTTRERSDSDLDSKETARSGMYYLGGKVLTLNDVRDRDGLSSILYKNMECNGYARVIEVRGFTHPLGDDDVVLGGKA